MADFEQNNARPIPGTYTDTGAIDQGLRQYMLGVYNYMAFGLAITGLIAFLTASLANPTQNPELFYLLYGSPLRWVIMLAPIGMVFLLSFRVGKMSLGATQASFWIFAALMGLSLSAIFLVYTGNSIARVFFITAASFGALSIYGYTTTRDLSGWGSFLFMGLIGIILASVVNLFLGSNAVQFAISVIGVLVFAGLTAYDTQQIKEMYYEGDGAEASGKKSIMGALRLYLDFINMFIMLLHLFGNRN